MERRRADEQIDRSAAAARAAMGGELERDGEPRAAGQRGVTPAEDDTLLDHYFKRIDPKVAASFTAPQRQALRTILGMRGKSNHAIEVRRNIAIGKSRFYIVFLFGRDHRAMARLHREKLPGRSYSAYRYLGLALLLLLPVFGLIYFG